jgi:hypothetical protein
MHRFLAAIALLATLSVGALLAAQSTSAGTPPATSALTCKPLSPYPDLKGQLMRLATSTSSQKLTFRKLYYGHCGTTRYAELFLFGANTGDTDQPGQFRRSAGGSWKIIGDGGCDPSNHRVPAALKKRWGDCSG